MCTKICKFAFIFLISHALERLFFMNYLHNSKIFCTFVGSIAKRIYAQVRDRYHHPRVLEEPRGCRARHEAAGGSRLHLRTRLSRTQRRDSNNQHLRVHRRRQRGKHQHDPTDGRAQETSPTAATVRHGLP